MENKELGIGGAIKEILSIEGMTREDLIKQVKTSPWKVYRLFSGKTEDPRWSTIAEVAEILHVSVDDLVGFAYSQGDEIRVYRQKLQIEKLKREVTSLSPSFQELALMQIEAMSGPLQNFKKEVN